MNINIARAVVRKMVNDVTQPDRPLTNLVMSIMREADISTSDIVDRKLVVETINDAIEIQNDLIEDENVNYWDMIIDRKAENLKSENFNKSFLEKREAKSE